MASKRKRWDDLSPAYRQRLGRAGISQRDHERGATIRHARGHRATPERPRQAIRNPEKFSEYRARKAMNNEDTQPRGNVDKLVSRIQNASSLESIPGGPLSNTLAHQNAATIIAIAMKLRVESAVPAFHTFTPREQWQIADLWLRAFMTHAKAADDPILIGERYVMIGLGDSLLTDVYRKHGIARNDRAFWQAFGRAYNAMLKG